MARLSPVRLLLSAPVNLVWMIIMSGAGPAVGQLAAPAAVNGVLDAQQVHGSYVYV